MMTYEDRQHYRELRERAEALRAELQEGDPEGALSRAEALRLVELLEATLDRVSPERWDHSMEIIAGEVMRRLPTPL